MRNIAPVSLPAEHDDETSEGCHLIENRLGSLKDNRGMAMRSSTVAPVFRHRAFA